MSGTTGQRLSRRDFRDEVIEALADAEAALRARARLEQAMLLDRLEAQRGEIARLRTQVANLRAELWRYTAAAVTGQAA
jgi:polyhydroxyalkanoate synthesis regulator phasin